jgi:ATPase subunit of ABC transporter with duplicated ATPase domains
MLLLQHLTYIHPNKEVLFNDINLTINGQDKVALIGNNGAGKSTLLKIIAGVLQPSKGTINTGSASTYYIPQLSEPFNAFTIGHALRVEDKLKALKGILEGNVSEENLTLLNDDWDIEARCMEALKYWQLDGLDLHQKMGTLSGGQKTKVFLAGISIHQLDIVLLDEPSNHLDASGRHLLYDFIQSCQSTLIVVSHDRKLLNLLDAVYELGKRGITLYGGNYDFYLEQKWIESNALDNDLKNKEKALRKAKDTERETIERQQKLDARGKKKQEKSGLPTISMNTFRNNAEKSTSRIKGVHAEKVGAIAQELNALRKEMPDMDKMKFGFDNAGLHNGKILFTAKEINHGFDGQTLWKIPMDFQITSGERIAIKGGNGSGKTTLIKIILRTLTPQSGTAFRADHTAVYIDQDYSLINNQLNVYEQALQFNLTLLQEHEIKIRLNRFLFTKEDWDKKCAALSGGEKMRLILCCLTISNQAPDVIVLDEPTNNLDIQNVEILTAAINDYRGTILVVSHDAWFLEQINIERVIDLDRHVVELKD